MTTQEWNTALYQKMFAEQEKYREWLLSQPPEEILHHAYEYVMREDILLSLEYNSLTGRQAKALEKSPSPLQDIFQARYFLSSSARSVRSQVTPRSSRPMWP